MINRSDENFSLRNFIMYLQTIIDEGYCEDIDSVIKACDDGIIPYLELRYGKAEDRGNLFYPECYDKQLISRVFSNFGIISANDVRRKYLINNNGLCYLTNAAVSMLCNGYDQYIL